MNTLRSRFIRFPLTVAFLLALVVAGCGGDDAAPPDGAIPDAPTNRDGHIPAADSGIDAAAGLTVTITSPVSPTYLLEDSLTVQVAVSGGPDVVELWVDDALLVGLTPPYQYMWDVSALAEGDHTLVAVARRDTAEARSSDVMLIVDRTPPELIGTTPAETEDYLFGTPIELQFSEPMAAPPTGSIVLTSATDEAYEITVDMGASDDTVVVRLVDGPTSAGGELTATLATSLTDRAGQPVSPTVVSWSTPLWIPDDYPIVVRPSDLAGLRLRGGVMSRTSAAGDAYVATGVEVLGPTASRYEVQVFRRTPTGWERLGASDPRCESSQWSLAIDAGGRVHTAVETATGAQLCRWDGSVWAPTGPEYLASAAGSVSYFGLGFDPADEPVLLVHTNFWGGRFARLTSSGWVQSNTADTYQRGRLPAVGYDGTQTIAVSAGGGWWVSTYNGGTYVAREGLADYSRTPDSAEILQVSSGAIIRGGCALARLRDPDPMLEVAVPGADATAHCDFVIHAATERALAVVVDAGTPPTSRILLENTTDGFDELASGPVDATIDSFEAVSVSPTSLLLVFEGSFDGGENVIGAMRLNTLGGF